MYNELPGALIKMQITILWRLRACFSEELLGYVCTCAYPFNSKDIELSFVKKETQP